MQNRGARTYMESKTKFMGHPIHQMLIVFPLGLLVTAVVFDLAYFFTGNEIFPAVAFYNITAGLLVGLVAALFGFNDWRHIPTGTRARFIGAAHGLFNLAVIILFLAGWLIRRDAVDFIPTTLAFLLSLLGGLAATVSGWLGGELVDRLGVGVDRGANLNAPSSLSRQPASLTAARQVPAVVPVTGGEKYQEKHIVKTTPVDELIEPKLSRDNDRYTHGDRDLTS